MDGIEIIELLCICGNGNKMVKICKLHGELFTVHCMIILVFDNVVTLNIHKWITVLLSMC